MGSYEDILVGLYMRIFLMGVTYMRIFWWAHMKIFWFDLHEDILVGS